MNQVNQTVQSRDVYQIITDRIVACLEKGVVPWKKTWTESGLPQNLLTRKPYRGINILLLSLVNYPLNYFLSFRQAIQLGGSVKKGEKAHPVVFYKREEYEDEMTKEKRIKSFLRYYMVFNVAQCEGIPEGKIPLVKKPNDPIHECEVIIQNMPNRPSIIAGGSPFYEPVEDYISMPDITAFDSNREYYTTIFHELIHSTGHSSRQAREGVINSSSRFGSATYSYEELIAEFGACYLMSYAGFNDMEIDNNASYIQGWLKKLQNDKKFIVYATAQAQKAVDYILNVTFEEKTKPVGEGAV